MYQLVKYNNGLRHNLDSFTDKNEAIKQAKVLHHPDWPDWENIAVYDVKTKSLIFNSGEKE